MYDAEVIGEQVDFLCSGPFAQRLEGPVRQSKKPLGRLTFLTLAVPVGKNAS